jgi:short-subunit dehydrogenase
MDLKDKVIIITGAGSGLGKALATKTASQGGILLLVDVNEKFVKQTQQEIEQKSGKAESYMCDITDLNEIDEVTQTMYKKYHRIDILINNAGIWTDEELEEKNPILRKKAFEINALGHIQFTKAVLPFLKKQNSGHIFNVISTAGLDDTPAADNTGWQTYGASKWAMTGFTKALRESLSATKIKVTAFHPGGFDSNLYQTAGRPNSHNQPWMMKTDDVADVALFALTRPADVLIEKIVVTKIM